MPNKPEIPFRNRSPFGWWVYRELEQWIPDPKSKKKKCLVWENTRIIQAKTREEAYEKAKRLGAEGNPRKTEGGRWKFLGIADLLPIYEELEDGAEIIWNDLGYMSPSKAKALVATKKSLQVFNDKENCA